MKKTLIAAALAALTVSANAGSTADFKRGIDTVLCKGTAKICGKARTPDYPNPKTSRPARDHAGDRWGMPPPPKFGGAPVTTIRNTASPHWRGWLGKGRRIPAWSRPIVLPSNAPEAHPETKTK